MSWVPCFAPLILAILVLFSKLSLADQSPQLSCNASQLFVNPLTDAQLQAVHDFEQNGLVPSLGPYISASSDCLSALVVESCFDLTITPPLEGLQHNQMCQFVKMNYQSTCVMNSLTLYPNYLEQLSNGVLNPNNDQPGCYGDWLTPVLPPTSSLIQTVIPRYYSFSAGSPLFKSNYGNGTEFYYRQLAEGSIFVTNASDGYSSYTNAIFQVEQGAQNFDNSNPAPYWWAPMADPANAELLSMPKSDQCGRWKFGNYAWQFHCVNLVFLVGILVVFVPSVLYSLSFLARFRGTRLYRLMKGSDVLMSGSHKPDFHGYVVVRKTRMGGFFSLVVLSATFTFLVWLIVVLVSFNASTSGTLSDTMSNPTFTFAAWFNVTLIYQTPSVNSSTFDLSVDDRSGIWNCAQLGFGSSLPSTCSVHTELQSAFFTLNDTFLPTGFSGAFWTFGLTFSHGPPQISDDYVALDFFYPFEKLANVSVNIVTDFSTVVWTDPAPKSGDYNLKFLVEPVTYRKQVAGLVSTLSGAALLPYYDGVLNVDQKSCYADRCRIHISLYPPLQQMNFQVSTISWSGTSAAFMLFVTVLTTILSVSRLILGFLESFTPAHRSKKATLAEPLLTIERSQSTQEEV